MSAARDLSDWLARNRKHWLPRLFPHGKIERGYFKIGGIDGGRGDSLTIPLSASKRGLRDFGNCWAGDDLKLVADRKGLTVAQTMEFAYSELGAPRPATWDRLRAKAEPPPRQEQAAKPNGADHHKGVREPTTAEWRWQGREPVATFTYHGEDGRALYHVGRYEDGRRKRSGKAAKDYVPLSWNGQWWEHQRPEDPVLYNLPDVMAHPPEGWVVFVEGEKVVDAARDLFERDVWRMTFTTSMGGPSQIKDQDLAAAEGTHVIVAADGDDQGDKAALELAARLEGVAATVKVWQPPPEFRALKKGWDLADAAEGLLPEGWDVDRLAYAIQAAPTLAEVRIAELGILTDAELEAREFKPPEFIIPDLIPVGLTFLAGKPKAKKSWLMLGAAHAKASGGRMLDSIDCEPGGVLYIGLEDQHGRLKARMRCVRQGDGATGRAYFVNRWKRLDQGGLDDLRLFLRARPDVHLVVVDTFAKVRPRPNSRAQLYDEDYEAGARLKAIADEFNVAIVCIHHVRKAIAEDFIDDVSGSTGLTGAADAILVLRGERGKADAVLHATGRDLSGDRELALQWHAETARWTLLGDAEEVRRSEEQRTILEALAEAVAPMTPKQIAEQTGQSREAVRKRLWKLRREGVVKSDDRDRYRLVDAQ